MKRSVALGAVLAVFLVGLAAGGAGTRLFYSQRLEARTARVPFLAPHYMGRLERNLDLSPEQEQEIHGILEEAHEEADTLRRDVRTRLHRLMEQAHGEIKEVLTPEQRRRFEELPIHRRRWHGPGPHRRLDREKHWPPEGVPPGGPPGQPPGPPAQGPPNRGGNSVS